MSRKKLTVIFTLIAILIIQLFTSVSAQETTTNKTEVNTQTIIDKLTAEEIEKLSDKHTAGTAGPEQFKERLTKKYYNQQNWSYNWGWNWFFFIIAILGFVSALMSRYSNLNKQIMPIASIFGGIFLISSIFILPNFLSIVFGFKGFLLTLAYILIPILIIISLVNIKENKELSLLIMFVLSVFSLSFIMPNVIYMVAEQTKWGTMYWFFWIASCFFFVEIAEAIFNTTDVNRNKILELEQKNIYLLSENNNLTNQVNRYKQIEQRSNDYKNQLQKLENENSSLNSRIQTLNEQTEQLKIEHKNKEDKINELFNEAKYFNEQLKEKYSYLKTSYHNLDIISKQQEEQIEEKEKSIEELETQRLDLQSKKEELENEKEELENEIKKLNDTIDNLQQPKKVTIDKETIEQLRTIEDHKYIKETETGITATIPFKYTYNNNNYKIIGISPSIFKNWDKLENITFEKSIPIQNIPNSAFEGCTKLKNIALPISIEKIENSAFKGCTKLTKIEIPSGTKNIEKDAFRDCIELEKIILHDKISTIEESAFHNCEKLKEINIPNGVKYIKPYTFKGCNSLEKITLPKSIETIEKHAFEGCTGLIKIEIPQNVKEIEESAFNGCKNLKDINIPSGIKTIKPFTFTGCKNLEKITLPKSIESIGQNAFKDCGLTEIEIPQNTKTIEQYAFSNCNNLTEIYIPKTVEKIGDDAFSDIVTVYYSGSAVGKPWGADEDEIQLWENEDEYWNNKNKEEEEKIKLKANKENISIKFTCPNCGYNYEENELSKPKKKVNLKKNLPPKENKDSEQSQNLEDDKENKKE